MADSLKRNPYGGVWHSVPGILLRLLLWIIYFVLWVCLRGKKDKTPDAETIESIPDKPIPSLQLAQALNPKTPVNKLIAMVENESYHIRRALVRNPSLPAEYIEILRFDENKSVSSEVERHYPSNSGQSS